MSEVQVYDGDGVTPYEKDLKEKMQKVSDEIFEQVFKSEELRKKNAQRLAAMAINDLVGVQPMPEPVGLKYALRYRHRQLTGQGADHVVAEDPAGSTPDSSPAQPS